MLELEAKSLLDLLQKFPNEEACINHLETLYSVPGGTCTNVINFLSLNKKQKIVYYERTKM